VSAHPQDDQPYIIEANPRASRTVPFVAKAVGHPIAKYASLLMSGKTLKDINFTTVRQPSEHMLAEKHLHGGGSPRVSAAVSLAD
jgi:carbamoylphosphate synthase large subunit